MSLVVSVLRESRRVVVNRHGGTGQHRVGRVAHDAGQPTERVLRHRRQRQRHQQRDQHERL